MIYDNKISSDDELRARALVKKIDVVNSREGGLSIKLRDAMAIVEPDTDSMGRIKKTGYDLFADCLESMGKEDSIFLIEAIKGHEPSIQHKSYSFRFGKDEKSVEIKCYRDCYGYVSEIWLWNFYAYRVEL